MTDCNKCCPACGKTELLLQELRAIRELLAGVTASGHAARDDALGAGRVLVMGQRGPDVASVAMDGGADD